MTSLFKNLRVSEEFETLGKNGGEGSHTWQRLKNLISIDDDIIHFICMRIYSLSSRDGTIYIYIYIYIFKRHLTTLCKNA